MEIKQQLRLSQSLVMTPQLQQAIRLLQLSRLELVDEVRKELDNNPVLSDEEPAERLRNSPGEVRTITEHGGGVEDREYQRPEAKATEKVRTATLCTHVAYLLRASNRPRWRNNRTKTSWAASLASCSLPKSR